MPTDDLLGTEVNDRLPPRQTSERLSVCQYSGGYEINGAVEIMEVNGSQIIFAWLCWTSSTAYYLHRTGDNSYERLFTSTIPPC